MKEIGPAAAIRRVRADWTALGAADPLWAVCSYPDKRGGGWAPDEFFATGRAEVDAALERLSGFGLPRGRTRALDFGCGVGRLSAALAHHFDLVTGVDISLPMLEKARELANSGGRCEFVLNEARDLTMFADASFDLIYSDLVLQHLPPALSHGYLREFARILRPGGAMIIGVPTRTLATFKGLVFRYGPTPLVRLAQRVLLRYPAPMPMHGIPPARMHGLMVSAGAEVIAWDEWAFPAAHWKMARYFVRLVDRGR